VTNTRGQSSHLGYYGLTISRSYSLYASTWAHSVVLSAYRVLAQQTDRPPAPQAPSRAGDAWGWGYGKMGIKSVGGGGGAKRVPLHAASTRYATAVVWQTGYGKCNNVTYANPTQKDMWRVAPVFCRLTARCAVPMVRGGGQVGGAGQGGQGGGAGQREQRVHTG